MRGALVALVLLGLGCDAAGDAAAWIASAARSSAEAEAALAGGDRARARETLVALAERAPPRGVADADARLVRADAMLRLATLALADRDGEGALGWSERGLALGLGEDVLSAGLLIAHGRALEALGRAAAAARDYERAIDVSERLLDRVLPDGGAP